MIEEGFVHSESYEFSILICINGNNNNPFNKKRSRTVLEKICHAEEEKALTEWEQCRCSVGVGIPEFIGRRFGFAQNVGYIHSVSALVHIKKTWKVIGDPETGEFPEKIGTLWN